MKNFSLLDAIIILLFLLSVYLMLIKIFGNSPTDLAVAFGLFASLGGLLYKLNREVGEFKIKTAASFSLVRRDISELRHDISEMKQGISKMHNEMFHISDDISKIQTDISIIKKQTKVG